MGRTTRKQLGSRWLPSSVPGWFLVKRVRPVQAFQLLDPSSRSLSIDGTQIDIDFVFGSRLTNHFDFGHKASDQGTSPAPSMRRDAFFVRAERSVGFTARIHASKRLRAPEQYPNIEGPKTTQIVPYRPKAAIVQHILYQSLPLICQPLGSIGRRPW